MSDLRIAFAYDPPAPVAAGFTDTVSLEYEDSATVIWLGKTLARFGAVSDLPWGPDFAGRLRSAEADIVFNITEASGSRNRESLVPAIAESLGVPCTGTDAVGLGLSLDKMITKELASRLGITTPRAALVPGFSGDAAEHIAKLELPLLVKPNTGGSSMGIHDYSRVESHDDAYELARALRRRVGDEILVEEFVSGREITVAILETEHGIQLLPHAELVFRDGSSDSFYSSEQKSQHRKQIICPADLPVEIAETVSFWSLLLFKRLGCSDFARVDYRLDDDGNPFLLEINPLPGLSPYYGIFPIQAQAAGMTAEQTVESILRNTLARST